MKTKRIWLAAITIVLNSCLITTTLFFTSSCSSRNQQPVYNGKTLIEWLDDAVTNETILKIGDNEMLVTPTVTNYSYEAIRKIGTNAIPFLLKEISESGELQKKVDGGDNSYKTRLRLNKISLAFEILGSIAKPAVPELVQLLNNSNNFGFAAFALTQTDPQTAVVVLAQALTNNNIQTRIEAVHDLSVVASSANIALAVPNLIQCLKYQSSESDLHLLKYFTANTLGDIHARPDIAVPALLETLTNKSDAGEIRMASVRALGQFGNAAISAVPVLEQMTNNFPNSKGLEMVMTALEQIQSPSP